MSTKCERVKDNLETFFDIPFDVNMNEAYQEPIYVISPHNEMEELFVVKIHFRQRIRIIIEIEPQKFAASMVESMNQADENKIKTFLLYLDQSVKLGAKSEFSVNRQIRDMTDSSVWNEQWKEIRYRATKIIDDYTDEEYEIELVQEWAMICVGMFLSLLDVKVIDDFKYAEGKITHVTHNVYERNPVNRELCLSANGYVCRICGFDFEKKYGRLGYRFIHVHHLEMVSSYGGEKYINPVTEMIPVCPNCHAMLHRESPPLKPEQLIEIINSQIDKE